jgi:hypothetical protein
VTASEGIAWTVLVNEGFEDIDDSPPWT